MTHPATGVSPPRWRAFAQLVRTEASLNLREPTGLVVGLGLPVLLVVVFGSIPTFRDPATVLGGLSPLDVYGPVLMVFSLISLAMSVLPLRLATYRELGFLRRLAVTPVGPALLLAAQLTIYAAIGIAAIVLIMIIGALGFGLRLPGSVPGLVVTLLLAAAALFPLGLCIASVAPTAKAAGAIGGIGLFVLAFCSGLWWPLQTMPDVLRSIMEKTPTGAAVQALLETLGGHFPRVTPLAVLAAYAVVFTLLAIRTFRWE
jgi:ABC-2 type transport system permease protein